MFKKYTTKNKTDEALNHFKKCQSIASLDQIISGLKSSGMSHNTINKHLNNIISLSDNRLFKVVQNHRVYCGSLIVTISDNKLVSIKNNYLD